MEGLEVTVLLGTAVLVGTVLAPRLRIAAPLVLLVLGLVIGFVPQAREIQLPPEVVLLLFLPVMLFWESLTTSLRAIRRSLRYIAPMSTLLVVASAFAVAGLASMFGLPWEAALILGAAVAPPDATAVAALGRMLPQRMFMKLKAESLTNDGTALVLYAIAVSLAVGDQVSPLTITWTVVNSYLGGALAGIIVAALAYLLLRRLTGTLEINLTLLLVPFVAFLIAELIGASGVLAVVIAGLIVAWVSPRITTPASRRQAESVYPVLTYVLNGALFVLIGTEVMHVLFESSWGQVGRLVMITVAVWVVLIAVRLLFQLFSAPFTIPRGALRAATIGGDRTMPLRMWIVSTFAGFRGAVSLAIALSVPLVTASGEPIAARDEIIFITAGVIMFSLLVQGPMLPAIARWAKLPTDTAADEEYEIAERAISGAALAAIDDLALEHGVSDTVRDRVRAEGYEMLEYANARALARQRGLVYAADIGQEQSEDAELETMIDVSATNDQVPPGRVLGDGSATSGGLQMLAVSSEIDTIALSPITVREETTRLRLALMDRRREVLLRLRREGTIDDLVAWRIQGQLDLVEVKLRGVEEID
ncbi:Na+/H+ antiporter [Microbacterium sp. ZW T5_56]|uniref:Na+/H+ antiporter n=1 Tax=Microbacterium sp. ZW T5_56 TaxID=3378081 RepID=UPI003851D31D